ncbi:MAG: hypothetical protein SF053_03300 [Bacteroidia bacterium]|nr:hypothetical protein [Bacteroidia bacterium]
MKKDIPIRSVEDLYIAIVPDPIQPDGELWEVYILSLREQPIRNLLIASRGYGELEGNPVETSVLRHFFEEMQGLSYSKIENIQTAVFQLHNEYWISFTEDGYMYDKKYTFVAGSISQDYFTTIPLLGRRGVMIG